MITKSPNYWQNKIAAWMNESPIKVFDLKNRDKNAEEIIDFFNFLQFTVDKKKVDQAAYIASGLTRAALPYDDSEIKEITLKHPLVTGSEIKSKIQNVNVGNLKIYLEKKRQKQFLTIYFSHLINNYEKTI